MNRSYASAATVNTAPNLRPAQESRQGGRCDHAERHVPTLTQGCFEPIPARGFSDRTFPSVDAEGWIRTHVEPAGPLAVESDEPWATVWRVPLATGAAFFKACRPVQAFEPRLTAALAFRWPERIPELLGWDEERAWLLLRDAGTPLAAFGDQLDAWLAVLPLYAELQRGEALHVAEHLAGGVPDRRSARLPELFAELPVDELPLTGEDVARIRAFAPRFAELCAGLDSAGIPDSIQHDDLHAANVWARDGQVRILDWGDACVSHPFCTLADTFRLLERDLALMPAERRGGYDEWLASLLRRGLALADV